MPSAIPLGVDNSFAAVDVTALVKDWLNGILANNGVALVPNTVGTQIDLDSKENSTTGHYARLDISPPARRVPREPWVFRACRARPVLPDPLALAGATGVAGSVGPAGPHWRDRHHRPPSCAVQVSPVGTPIQNGAALVAAVATLGGASTANPYLVRIEPGIYNLGSQFLNLPASVDVEGSGAGVTKVISAAAPVINLTAASELRHLSVESTAGLAIRTSGRILHVVAKASSGSSNTGIEGQPAAA